jgi:hypothetical protein
MGKIEKSKWVDFERGNFSGSNWRATVEIVHDGWLIHLKNNSSMATSFFLLYAWMHMPPTLAEGSRLSISYLSEPLANPDEEVLLHLSFNFADGSRLRQATHAKLKYGMGVGEYRTERVTSPRSCGNV